MMACKTCNGTGFVVLYRKERLCGTCRGAGQLSKDVMIRNIAEVIDFPTLYASEPSSGSIRTAKTIVETLEKQFGLFESKKA